MTNNEKRIIITIMEERGFFEYGATTPIEEYRTLFNIQYPTVGTKKDFDAVSLIELEHFDFIRSQLLNQGKYLKVENDHVRVLLPSENISQVQKYMNNADNKLKRAIKLAKNTPKEVSEQLCQVSVRAHMKRESIKTNQARYS